MRKLIRSMMVKSTKKNGETSCYDILLSWKTWPCSTSSKFTFHNICTRFFLAIRYPKKRLKRWTVRWSKSLICWCMTKKRCTTYRLSQNVKKLPGTEVTFSGICLQGHYDYIPKLCFSLKSRRYVKELQRLCIWLSHNSKT